MRQRHYALRAEKAYLGWIKRFILFHHKRHPQEMSGTEIEAFLTHRFKAVHQPASTGFHLWQPDVLTLGGWLATSPIPNPGCSGGKRKKEPPVRGTGGSFFYNLLLDPILGYDLPEPMGALLGGPLAAGVINPDQAKTLLAAVRPLKIVQQAPDVVAP